LAGGYYGYGRWGYGGGAGIGLGTVLVIVLVCFMLGLFAKADSTFRQGTTALELTIDVSLHDFLQ